MLQNSSQFYRWHTELEAARTLETEQKYRNYAEALKGHLTSCDHLLEKVLPAPLDVTYHLVDMASIQILPSMD